MKDPRERIQEEAFAQWKDKGEKGTIQAITGIGKTFIALKAVAEMDPNDRILFLAETRQRERDFKKEIDKFSDLYGVDFTEYNIEIMCYQSAYKRRGMTHDLVIADEIHDSLTPKYSRYYANNTYYKIMGLSATIDDGEIWFSEDRSTTKLKMLSEIAPICYIYNIEDGQREGTTRPLDVFVLHHRLGTVRNVLAGTKKKPFMTTEQGSYEYWDKRFKRSFFVEPDKRELQMALASRKRAAMLYTLPSKVVMVNKLLENLKGKTLIFGNDLKALEQITSNVVRAARKGEKVKEIEKRNERIREQFDKGEIDVIASFKMLKQGANLKNVDNVIVMSYYGKQRDLLQRIGRLRKEGNKIGTVIIPVTVGTQEVKWFESMTDGISLNTIPCLSLDELISKL